MYLYLCSTNQHGLATTAYIQWDLRCMTCIYAGRRSRCMLLQHNEIAIHIWTIQFRTDVNRFLNPLRTSWECRVRWEVCKQGQLSSMCDYAMKTTSLRTASSQQLSVLPRVLASLGAVVATLSLARAQCSNSEFLDRAWWIIDVVG